MDYLIRFTHLHESFRIPEIEALADLNGLDLQVLEYSLDSPFCVVRLPSEAAARTLVERAILVQSMHELWGSGDTLSALHADIRTRSARLLPARERRSFKFTLDGFRGTRSPEARTKLINGFAFLGLRGPVSLSTPDEVFTIFEDWECDSVPRGVEAPRRMHLGRFVTAGARDTVLRYDLKKRGYISTTSMDAELALVTANMAGAAPGRLVYDPFVGTGSFPVACAHFGALAFGSDIDGRSMRGEGGRKSLAGNFEQYSLGALLGDVFSADLTNSPIRAPTGARLFDAIVCDPPYGVREGLRVLGVRDPVKYKALVEMGIKTWRCVEDGLVFPSKHVDGC